MTSFFGVGGNPFSTPVGQKIEQATDGSLASENWALNMEICDLINETEEGPKDAIKAIRRRLQQSVGKNYTIVMFTLTVLETCVKNCGKRFHILVCNKEFISELVKLIGPKNGPPTAVQEKVLSLIQSWVDAFHQHQDLNGVVQVYQELRIKGIEFPMTDLDSMAPIHTPKKSVKSEPERVKTPPQATDQSGMDNVDNVVPTGTAVGIALTPEQLSKLKADLDIVQANMTVFGEMLNELSSPGPQPPADMELFQELHTTLVAMQERLVELISKLSSDEITAELLRINDHLNNLFLRYTRFEKNRNAKEGNQGLDEAGLQSDSLIDLGDEATGPIPAITKQMGSLAVGPIPAATSPVKSQVRLDAADSDFDMFAQSRNVTYENSKAGGSTYESNSKPDQVSGNLAAAAEARAQGSPQNAAAAMHKESDFDEMAAWLAEGGGAGGGEESLTSSEFERFLAERAAAAEALPTTGNPAAATVASPRRTGKHAETESSLFAL
ncbi:TOM1-like protein 2 isoform X2 [Rhodnius prolixus]|uniref:TOM1-like protein 2 isoform X2 n=1 Tax=Rhodnius prolixus TaxID=13249 RepID=UPI003D189121